MPTPTIPNYWTYQNPIEATKDTLRFTPYFGPEQTRGFGDGGAHHNWEIGDDDSDHDNFVTIKSFWETNFPGVHFYLYDPQLDETRTYEIDSTLTFHYNHQDSYSWKMKIKEVYPYTKISGPPPP